MNSSLIPRVRPLLAAAGTVLLALVASKNIGLGPAPAPSVPDPDKVVRTPDVPHDVPGGTRLPPTQASEDLLGYFAWEQFLALCWQSDYNVTTHSRGAPDRSWDHSKPYKPGQPLVWETYAHKTELRPFGVPLNKPFSKAPEYLIEVPLKPACATTRFDLFNNLDEDNEIGSCSVYLGSADPLNELVIYQAKVNQAEYDYIRRDFGATQHNPAGKLAVAAAANKYGIVYGDPNKIGVNLGLSLPAGDLAVPGRGGEGAIEIKTAFQRVTAANRDQLKDFFQTQAIYYTACYDEKTREYSNFTYHNGTFALLAIHVIHKTKSYPDFIFTSFEHKSLANLPFKYKLLSPLPESYGNFNPYDVQPLLGAADGTQLGEARDIKRQTGISPSDDGKELYPIPPYLDRITAAVHAALRRINPKSVWLNYRLMGVQANITEKWAPKPSQGAGPNHFMANHVVESDPFLGRFFGPGFSFPGPFKYGNNILFNGKQYNAGGCKGCHGVAQVAFGTDFSFLLDFGKNKPEIQPDTIIYHPEAK